MRRLDADYTDTIDQQTKALLADQKYILSKLRDTVCSTVLVVFFPASGGKGFFDVRRYFIVIVLGSHRTGRIGHLFYFWNDWLMPLDDVLMK